MKWELWTYDVWGNKKDGFEVNDRFCIDRQFETTNQPSEKEIKQAFNIKFAIDIDGDDTIIFINRKKDDYPIGEMIKI